MKAPLISIVVPCKRIDSLTEECVSGCLRLDYDRFEILILPHVREPISIHNKRVRVIPTGNVRPSEKRNVGIERSRGEICAFIDSDAYPRRDWLKEVVGLFEDVRVGAVCGPGVTPPGDSFMQRAGGEVLASRLGSGRARMRCTPVDGVTEVDDWPTFNLICRKDVLKKIGGFSVDFWPGEDTKLCLDIVEAGYKILYSPEVVVYHHRRSLFVPHLKQISQYGIHRGYFAKLFPKTSRRLFYFLPSIAVVLLAAGAVFSLFFLNWAVVFLGIVIAYLLMALLSSFGSESLRMAPVVSLGLVLTHLIYGIAFLKGLASRKLEK